MAKKIYDDENVHQVSEFILFDEETLSLTLTDYEGQAYIFNELTAEPLIQYFDNPYDYIIKEDIIDFLFDLEPVHHEA